MLLLRGWGGGGGGNIVYNLGENYMLYLSGQKRGMSELKYIWPVILTGECPKIISSPDNIVSTSLQRRLLVPSNHDQFL